MLKRIIRTYYLVGLKNDVVNDEIGIAAEESRNRPTQFRTQKPFFAFASKQRKTKKTSVQIAGGKTINKNGVHERRHYTYYGGEDGAKFSAYVPKQCPLARLATYTGEKVEHSR